MKSILVISMVSLLLLPIFSSGLAFAHYAAEHIHLFCHSDLEHSHPNKCQTLTLFQSSQSQNQLPIPTKIEVQELKLYCLTHDSSLCLREAISLWIVGFEVLFPQDNLFAKDVFHPPIFA